MTFKVKGHGRKVTWTVWQVLAHKSGIKSPGNIEIGRKVAHLQYIPSITRTKFEVRSKVKITRPINAETDSVSLTNFKLDSRLEHALSTAMASYKGLWILGYCTRSIEFWDWRLDYVQEVILRILRILRSHCLHSCKQWWSTVLKRGMIQTGSF